MKIKNIPTITGLICASTILNMINLSFATDYNSADQVTTQPGSLSKGGYRPVLDECPDLEDSDVLCDNYLYREWCQETFNNGNCVYEAYKDIAFNIKYTPESAKTDFWQTPVETNKSGSGDCEDAVFLFHSHLPPNQENAKIIWGWVIDKRTGVAKAHVWYQLVGKEGQPYIVEGFSNDWNGIIPMETIEKTETRRPILAISHLEASKLASLVSRPDSRETYQLLANLHKSINFTRLETNKNNIVQDRSTKYHPDTEFFGYNSMSREYKISWRHSVKDRINTVVSEEISKIFNKLHELFTRCEKQRESYTEDIQVAFRSINNIHSNRNLNCRR